MNKVFSILMIGLFSTAVYAGTTHPGSTYQWKAGCDVILNEGDITLTKGVEIKTNGLTSPVFFSTGTALAITHGVMIVCSTGTAVESKATPFISTTSYTQGTMFTLTGGTATLTLQDDDTLVGSLLELGATTRDIGTNDILQLYLLNDRWIEIGYSDLN